MLKEICSIHCPKDYVVIASVALRVVFFFLLKNLIDFFMISQFMNLKIHLNRMSDRQTLYFKRIKYACRPALPLVF